MVTKQDCINGGLFRYLKATYKSRGRTNEPIQVRSSGRCQTWKTRPDDFKLPVKYGMYESSYITQDNAPFFITEAEYQQRGEQAQAVSSVLKENPLQLKPAGNNQTVVELDDGSEVFFSYKTPVAAYIPGQGMFRTNQRWSVTTSKHIGKYLRGRMAAVKPQAWFDSLVSGFRNNPRRPSPESSGIHIDIGSHNARRNPKSEHEYKYKNRRETTGLRWNYKDARGVPQSGILLQVIDRGGTDVTYIFKRDDGKEDYVSGHYLKFAARANPKRKHAMPKRRRTITIRRPAHAKRYGAGHPYFSKLPIHVQEKSGVAWKTVAAFVGTPEGIRRAKQYANIWKRERGRITVRLVDIR